MALFSLALCYYIVHPFGKLLRTVFPLNNFRHFVRVRAISFDMNGKKLDDLINFEIGGVHKFSKGELLFYVFEEAWGVLSSLCAKAVCLNRRLIAFGAPADILNEKVLSETFGTHLLLVHMDGKAYAYEHHQHDE